MRTDFRAKLLRQVLCQMPGIGDSKLEIKYKQDFALKIPFHYNGTSTRQSAGVRESEWRRKIIGRIIRLSDRNGLFPYELWGIRSRKAKNLVQPQCKTEIPIWLSRDLHSSFTGFIPFSLFPTKPHSDWTMNYSVHSLAPTKDPQPTHISHRRGRRCNSPLQIIYTWSLSAKRLTLRPVRILLLFVAPHQAAALLLIFATGGMYYIL